MEITSSAFEDIGVDPQEYNFLTKEGAQPFAAAVMAAVKKLEDVMDSTAKISTVEADAYRKVKDNPALLKKAQAYVKDFDRKLFSDATEMPLEEILALVNVFRTIAHDLENVVHERSRIAAMETVDSLNDKKFAQMVHKRVRETWEPYRSFVKLFFKIELPTIKPRSGNYMPTITKYYQYIFPDGDTYLVHTPVIKRLGISGTTFADLWDWLEENPDVIQVKEFNL